MSRVYCKYITNNYKQNIMDTICPFNGVIIKTALLLVLSGARPAVILFSFSHFLPVLTHINRNTILNQIANFLSRFDSLKVHAGFLGDNAENVLVVPLDLIDRT